MSTTASDEQCKALTTDGERCSRPARDNGFCYQHDSSDETVDEADDDEQSGDDQAGDEQSGEDQVDDGDDTDEETGDEQSGDDQAGDEEAGDEADNGEEGGDRTTGDANDQETDMASTESESADTNIGEVRQTVQETAEGVVGHPLDGITSIDDTDEGWRVAVEVVERKSVPDTQDILGRYEITLDGDLSVTGYQRTHRYRRDDMNHDI